MKVGIISDTHDNLDAIKKAVEFFNYEKVELVLHAGDYIAPFTAKIFSELGVEIIGIYGNNDGEKLGLRKAYERIAEIHDYAHEVKIDKKKLLITHYPDTVDALLGYYDVVIYGHTHKVDYRKKNGKIILNPGECCGYLSGRKTVAILDTERMEVVIKELKT
jgi:hypothetical protein